MESRKSLLIFLMIAAVTYMFFAEMKENDDRYYTRNSTITLDNQLLDGISEIKENEKKILISVNKGGPNNQIWGFREGLLLASLLGHEFVASLFFRHFTTKGHFHMNPDLFIDMENLSRLE